MNNVVNTVISSELMAQSLTQQYDDISRGASDLVRRVVNFGCALLEAERVLSDRGLLSTKSGKGLAAWLAENCPTVNYKTAMRWKQVALGVSHSLECDAASALDILDGKAEVTGRVAKRRDEITSVESVRKLCSVLFDFSSEERGTAGRPDGTKSSGAKLTRIESARRLWAAVLSMIARNREGLYSAAKLLPLDEARVGLQELKQLTLSIERRVKEGK